MKATKTDSGAFRRLFGLQRYADVSDWLHGIDRNFETGADPATLSAEHAHAVDRVVRASTAGGQGPAAVRRVELDTAPLEVRGLNASQRSGYLSGELQDFFADFGVLPPLALQGVSPTEIGAIEEVCDALRRRSFSTTLGYLFSREILELALDGQILATVASILGENLTLVAASGPMYLPPRSETKTGWHAASGRSVGGGDGHSLDMVSVWVALTDATPENGCMTMAPRSFQVFRTARKELMRLRIASFASKRTSSDLPAPLREWPLAWTVPLASLGEVSPDWIRKAACRYLAAPHTPGLWIDDVGRYSPFHESVDLFQLMRTKLDDEQLYRLPGCIHLPARSGEAYFFTSENFHASLRNRSDHWRKAISLRYLATSDVARLNTGDGEQQLPALLSGFHASHDWFAKLGLTHPRFKTASPRVCVRGDVPASVRDFYIDLERLREGLERNNQHVRDYIALNKVPAGDATFNGSSR